MAVTAAGWVVLVTRRLRRFQISTTSETPPKRTANGERQVLEHQIALSTKQQKVIGSVHSIWGASARQHCLENGGRVAVLFRDPIARVLSLTRVYIDRQTRGNGHLTRSFDSPQGETIINIIKEVHLVNKIKPLNEQINILQFTFILNILSVFALDMRNMGQFHSTEWFIFEHYAGKSEGIKNLMKFVLPDRFEAKIESCSIDKIDVQHNRSKATPTKQLIDTLNKDCDFVATAHAIIAGGLNRDSPCGILSTRKSCLRLVPHAIRLGLTVAGRLIRSIKDRGAAIP